MVFRQAHRGHPGAPVILEEDWGSFAAGASTPGRRRGWHDHQLVPVFRGWCLCAAPLTGKTLL